MICTVSGVLRDASGVLQTGVQLIFARAPEIQGVEGLLIAPTFGTAQAATKTVTTHASTAAFSVDLAPGDYTLHYQSPTGAARQAFRVPIQPTAELRQLVAQTAPLTSTLVQRAEDALAESIALQSRVRIRAVTASRALTLDDAGWLLRTTGSDAVVLTVPTGFAEGAVVGLMRSGTGVLSVVAGDGVTLAAQYGYALAPPSAASLIHVGADDWVMTGFI
jgi:hypothetical protein